MRKLIKQSIWTTLLLLTVSSSWGFVIGGPIGNGGDAWQVPAIGYGLPGDILAPKNIGEEYRRVTPVMYYAYDANFFGFFGLAGATNIDAAFGVMNSVTNVSTYSRDLSEFPLASQGVNYRAESLELLDLKSVTLQLIAEQMGLGSPERYAWTLHNRYQPPSTTCPDATSYLVIQRNLDYLTSPLNQIQYSPYVNDTLYTYTISDTCGKHPPVYDAVTVPILADPSASAYTAVASDNLSLGGFYTTLTRDDVAGLRYMLSSNNINYESTSSSGGLLLQTNVQPPSLLTTQPFSLFLAQSVTSAPPTMQSNYPGLTIRSVATNFVNQVTTNLAAYFTNLAGPYTNVGPNFSNSWTPVQYGGIQLVTNQPFGPLLAAAAVSAPDVLQALYPNLLIKNTYTNSHQVQVVTNVLSYFTNLAGPYTNLVEMSNGIAIYPSNGIVSFTNYWSPVQYGEPFVLTTLPLGPLLARMPYTDPITLQALYPGLVVASVTTNYLVVNYTTNIVPYYTNQSVLPVFSNTVAGGLPNVTTPTNIYFYTNQPGPTVINYDITQGSVPISTLDLATFADLSLTNPPATMLALYPGLQILRATTSPAYVPVTNYTSYLTNYTGAPYGGPPKLVTVASSYNYVWITNWHYTFGNVFTNHYYTNRYIVVKSIWTTNQIGAPVGSPLVYKTNYNTIKTNLISGDFFLIPTNWCGFDLTLSFPLGNPPYNCGTSNTVIYPGYNSSGSTGTNNVAGGDSYGLIQSTYDIYTNYNYAVYPGICQPVLVFGTNYSTNIVNTYQYGFANLVTNHYYTNTAVTVSATNVSYTPLGSPDLLFTNPPSVVSYYTNLPSGDFYIVPTNWCGFQILGLLTNTISTNAVVSGSNSIAGGPFYSVSTAAYGTNYTYSLRPGVCEPVVASSTTYATNIVTQYVYDFANIITNHYYTTNHVTGWVTNVAVWTNGLVGWVTNIVRPVDYWTNQVWGDFFIPPTNWCGYSVLGILTNAVVTTNTYAATNLLGVPLLPGEQYTVTSYTTDTNYIYSLRPGVCEPALIFATNYVTNYGVVQYSYNFSGIITNHFFTNGRSMVVTTNIAIWTNGLVGWLTNIVTTNVLTNIVGGDFYVVPPSWCGYSISGAQSTNVYITTNQFASTNLTGVADLGQRYTQTSFTSDSNTTYVVQIKTCNTAVPATALRQGIEHVQFIRANYDSLLGQFFVPLTNNYTMVMVTNSQPVTEYYQRVVTRPDFLMSAQDLTAGPAASPATPVAQRGINFDTTSVLPGLAGPGTLTPGTTFTFNKSGRTYQNYSPAFLSETDAFKTYLWASFDSSTNVVLYPNGTSIADLENQILMPVSPSTLVDGALGVAYPPVTFSATGGAPPYTWSATNISNLVPGMIFDTTTATLSGTPAASGTFSFTLQVTDSVNRVVSLNYTLAVP